MKKGQDDFGNKVEEVIVPSYLINGRALIPGKFETGDFIRVYNKEGCVIATYVIKVVK